MAWKWTTQRLTALASLRDSATRHRDSDLPPANPASAGRTREERATFR
jgi:hypothetical protein